MKVYKIRHKPTGVFFKPSRYPRKINLDKKGKIYYTTPSLKWLSNGYHHPLTKEEFARKYPDKPWLHNSKMWHYEHRPFIEAEWQIIELKMELA